MSVYRLLFGTLRGRVSCSVFRPYSLFPTPYSLLPALCLLLLASCAPANGPIPHILDVQSSASEVPRYDRFELVVALEATYDNPYDVRDVELFAVFTGPDGRKWPDDHPPAALYPRYCREAEPLTH
jgi:hypothetical protein